MVRMENHCVAMLERELLLRKVPHCCQEFVWWRADRHGEDDVVDEFGRFSAGHARVGGIRLPLLESEVPIVKQLMLAPVASNAIPFVGLYVQLSFPVDLPPMGLNPPQEQKVDSQDQGKD